MNLYEITRKLVALGCPEHPGLVRVTISITGAYHPPYEDDDPEINSPLPTPAADAVEHVWFYEDWTPADSDDAWWHNRICPLREVSRGTPISESDASAMWTTWALEWFVEKHGEPRVEVRSGEDGSAESTISPSMYVPAMVIAGGLERMLEYLDGTMEIKGGQPASLTL